MNPIAFLQAELDHAQRHLARVRRLQTKMRDDLEQAGLDELTVYERLATNKAHRQLQRDEVFYQQMWLRLRRHLDRLEKTSPQAGASPLPSTRPLPSAKPLPYRKPPTPGPNEKCPCHSGLKYKKCCGSPLRQTAPQTAAA